MERLPSVLTTNSGKVFGVEEEATLLERTGDPFDVWAPLEAKRPAAIPKDARSIMLVS